MTRKRLEFLVSLLVILTIFTASWFTISHYFRQEIIKQQTEYLEKKGQLLVNQFQSDGFLTEDAQMMIDGFITDDAERITLLDADGTIVYDSHDSSLNGERNSRPEVQAVLAGNAVGSSLRRSATLNQEMLYVALPIHTNDALSGVLRISETTAGFAASAENFRRSILITLTLAFIVIGSMVLYLLRQKNRPIETVLPVLKKMLSHPERSNSILQESKQWEELYLTINELSKKMSSTYLAYTTTEKQFYTLLNDLMIGVFIIDSEDQLRLANPKMQEHLGLLTMPNAAEYTDVIKDPQLIRLIHQVNSDHPFVQEILRLKFPHEQVLDFSIRYVQDAAQQPQLIGIAYDLTRVRQLEKVQRDFVGNVSHELKTPVTSLIGFTETLLDGAKDDPETLTEFLKIMQKDAQRLQQLIQEILQLSQDGQMAIRDTQAIELATFFPAIIESYRKAINEKKLTVEILGDESAFFVTSTKFFQPIVKNLIENAVNYSTENSKITLRYVLTPTSLTLSITDQGIGIDKDEQERIFERFYRVDKARSRNSGGTGLGLSIVKEYSKILGGDVHVKSQPEKGTTFIVQLPVNR